MFERGERLKDRLRKKIMEAAFHWNWSRSATKLNSLVVEGCGRFPTRHFTTQGN
jgi:hypothetical protein